jgi:hypothetical protein
MSAPYPQATAILHFQVPTIGSFQIGRDKKIAVPTERGHRSSDGDHPASRTHNTTGVEYPTHPRHVEIRRTGEGDARLAD